MDEAKNIRHWLIQAIDALERAYEANLTGTNPARSDDYIREQATRAVRAAMKVIRMTRRQEPAADPDHVLDAPAAPTVDTDGASSGVVQLGPPTA